MVHKCPHCQKTIAVKIKVELTTQEVLIDDYLEKQEVDNNEQERKINQ